MTLIRESLAPAQAAADGALLSARAAIGIQLPIIRVTPDKLGYGDIVSGGVQTELLGSQRDIFIRATAFRRKSFMASHSATNSQKNPVIGSVINSPQVRSSRQVLTILSPGNFGAACNWSQDSGHKFSKATACGSTALFFTTTSWTSPVVADFAGDGAIQEWAWIGA